MSSNFNNSSISELVKCTAGDVVVKVCVSKDDRLSTENKINDLCKSVMQTQSSSCSYEISYEKIDDCEFLITLFSAEVANDCLADVGGEESEDPDAEYIIQDELLVDPSEELFDKF
jgi:hypothetical protein